MNLDRRIGVWMIYKGTVAIVGDAGDPLPVNCEVSDERLMITAGDDSVIGDWGIREIGTERTSDGIIIHAEGEDLLVCVRDADAFARSLRIGQASDVATRMSAARASPDRDRLRPLLAVGIVAGLLAVVGIGLWVTGTPPFERPPLQPSALVAAESMFPPSTQAATTTQAETTTTVSATSQMQVFAALDVEFGDGLIEYLEDVNEAVDAGDYAAMGAACKLGKTWVEDWVFAFSITDIPDYEVRSILDAQLDEANLAFFWCSGGDRYAHEAAGPHFNMLAELSYRLADAYSENWG